MLHRVFRLSCSAAIFLAVGHPGVAANDNDPPAVSQGTVLAAGAKVSCSLHSAPDKPVDPPSTSSLPNRNAFVAGEHFREDISATADVRISWLGGSFTRRFVVKTEDEPDRIELQTSTLVTLSNDNEIIAALNDRHETRLADLWCLLKLQARGQSGALRADLVPNVFFMRDIAGELHVVDVIWGGAGWEIGASEVGDLPRWPRGARVISR